MTHPGDNLSQRAVKSGVWVFSLRVVQELFSLTRLMILARVLAPADFGLMGIALLSMATLETFSQTGFHQALIQKKHDIKPYLDSAWTFLILRGVILFATLYLIAPYTATFFDAPEAKPIIQIIGLSVIFQAFTNIGIIHFQKELEFNKQFIYQLSGLLTDFVVSIAAVLILKNVYAIVFGLLAGNAAMLITSYMIHPYRPHLNFDISKAKELFGYGKWFLGSSVLIFLLTQGDDIFVGKFLGITALGFYQMAYRISNLPATEITHVISQVTFPIYSKIQDDIPKLREVYLSVLQLTAFISLPFAALIVLLAPDFTIIFLGERWMPMVPVIMVLCIFGVTRSIGATMGPILFSVGKPKIQMKVSSIQLIAMAIIIYPLTMRWGILGASLGVVIPNIMVLILISAEVRNIIKVTNKDFVMSIITPVIAVSAMFCTMFLKQVLLPSVSSIHNFFIGLVLYVCTYIIIIYLLDRGKGYIIWHEIQEIVNNLGGK